MEPAMRSVLPLLAVLPLAFAPAPMQKPTDQAELRRFHGLWVLVSEFHGSVVQSRQLRWTVSGRSVVRTDDHGTYRWEVTLAPTATPKALDMRLLRRGRLEEPLRAIYTLKGDTLTLCYDMGQSTLRPRVDSSTNPSHCRQVFKRKKP